jgi:Phage related hypothetical protein (DUF1799)
MASDFQAFGMVEEAASYSQRPAPVFEIWPENEIILNVFVSQDTQWRLIAGMASCSYLGLDYRALRDTLEMTGIKRKRWPEIFSGIRVMESAALKVFRAKEV